MKQYLSFDIGGTLIKYGIMQEDFTILKQNETENPIHEGIDEFTHFLLATIENLKKEYQLSGVCISTAGVVDTQLKKIIYANANMPNYTNFSFQTEIEDKVGLPLSVENDVYCFALAESTKNLHNYCLMTIGTGIGGAIIIDQKLQKGVSKTAGSFGQMYIENNQKLEDLASLKSLLQDAKSRGLYVKNGLELFKHYDQNEETAVQVVQSFYKNLSKGILNISYSLNPETIFLAGGITKRSSFLQELLRELEKLSNHHYHTTKIQIASYAKEGGLIGALVHHLTSS